jgi:hypothetical protein
METVICDIAGIEENKNQAQKGQRAKLPVHTPRTIEQLCIS